MKKTGILNGKLAGALTDLRHTDKLVICDAGFPVPDESKIIDISLIAGIPSMLQVLKAVLNEIIFEEFILFDMLPEMNPMYNDEITKLLKRQRGFYVSMADFQEASKDARLYIRTGDLTPCANILLISASGVRDFCSEFDVSCMENIERKE